MNLETKIIIYKFTPQVFTLTLNMLNMYKKKTVPIRFSGNSSSNYWNSRKKSLFLHFKQEKLWEQLNG